MSAVIFIPEVGSLATWFNRLALAVAMAVMAAQVAAYHHLRQSQSLRLNLRCLLATWALVSATFAPLFLVAGDSSSFRLLGLFVLTLVLTILSHALADPARCLLDCLFFGREVQHLRSNLAGVVQDIDLTPDRDLGARLSSARTDVAEVSREHLVRLTVEALRRLSNPAALAECGLIGRLPRTLNAARGLGDDAGIAAATPLEQAQAVREVLARAIERLKPPDRAPGLGAPEALQYHILREEYLLGLPNVQVMTRHSISEGTFHRHRRQAIAILARELEQEERRRPVAQQ